MARIRTIKPDFWKSPKVSRVSRDARLLFVGLLTEADDEGRFLASPKLLVGALFPHDADVTVGRLTRWLSELEEGRMVELYEIDGIAYGLVVGFKEHQRISHPTPSRLPSSSGQHETLFGSDSGVTPPGKERNGTGNREAEIEAEFVPLWELYPKREGSNPRKPALKAYAARRHEGVPAEDLAVATRHYAESRAGEDAKFTMMAATFFGPNERWAEFKTKPTGKRGANGARGLTPDYDRGGR